MIKKISLRTITLLLISLSAYAQTRTDSVGYINSELLGLQAKTLNIGFANCSGLRYTYNSLKIHTYFYMGNDYKFASTPFASSVTFKIDLYSTPSGSSGLLNTISNITLALNQNAPEKEYVFDATSYASQGAVRAVITVTSYTQPLVAAQQNRIRMASFYKEDVGVNVTGKSVTISSVTVKSPVKFVWRRNVTEQCIPNYQVQVLRLFNKDPSKLLETQLTDTVHWARALNIETGSPDTILYLNLAEGRGYYTWRVRPIGTAYPGGIADSRNFGNWSSTSLAENAVVTGPLANVTFFYYQFDDNLNWIYSRTFSEGDPMNTRLRMSESMTWANGLQQVKQQQVRQVSADTIVANQTIYDYSARPAVKTLPSPIPKDTFGYYPGFIKVGSVLYGPADFDENTTLRNPTAASAGQLNTYYSNSNSDLFVPNAQGFPYSRTIYERDATGRVREQGGPGETHRIKSVNERTTKTISSGVSDQELIRVFGDEAPEAKSVYKVLNIDANNTASISYISKEGQTIATALSIGLDSTNNILDTVPGYKQSRVTIKDTVWGNKPYGDYGITSSKPLVFAVPTTVNFKYTITKKDIAHLCQNICSTCDYTIEFLLHDDDTTITLSKTLLGAAACNTAHGWTSNFTRTLSAGKKYIFEKRVYANNIITGSAPPVTYLQKQINSLDSLLQKRANDSLAIVNGFLSRNSMDSLYRYLNKGTFINFNLNSPDSIFADSVFVKNIGCTTIKIPVTFCEKPNCTSGTQDFEKYFNDRWKWSGYADTSSTNYIDFLAYPYQQTTYRFQKGQFNYLVKNMITNGYSCTELWDCWKSLTLNYGNLKKLADTSGTGYKLDLFEEFMRCAGRKLTGFHSTDTSMFLGQAYKYFYKPASTTSCDNLITQIYGTIGSWLPLQDSLNAVDPKNKKWENYYKCTLYGRQGTNEEGNTNVFKSSSGCREACDARYESFKLAIINMYHNDSIYIEGDKYKLQKNRLAGQPYVLLGQKYGWSVDTLTSTPAPAYYRSMAEVECMARSLVEECRKGCTLTLLTNPTRYGTPAELLAMEQSSTWGFDLQRPTCGSGYTTVTPLTGTVGKINKIWDKDFGGTGDDFLYSILNTLDGGFLLGGYTNAPKSNDVTDTLYGLKDYWLVKYSPAGTKIWDRTYGGSADDVLRSIEPTSDGGFLLTGTSNSPKSTSPLFGNKASSNYGGYDYWVVKVDVNGVRQWDASYGGSGSDFLTEMIKTSDGKYILAGYSDSPGSSSYPKHAPIIGGISDFWVIKIGGDSLPLWDQTYGTTSTDYCTSIQELADGNYIFGGYTDGGISGNKSQASYGGNDYWIIKVNPLTGTKIWDKAYGGSGDDQLLDITQARDGNILLAGQSNSGISGSKTLACYGGYDGWLLKVSDDAVVNTIAFQREYGGSKDDGGKGTSCAIGGGICVITSGMKIAEMPDKSLLLGLSSYSPKNGNKGAAAFLPSPASNDSSDFWILKTDPLGNKQWDTIYGGTKFERFSSFLVDNSNNFWFAGISRSAAATGNKTFALYNTPGGNYDFWVVKTRFGCTHDNVCLKWVDNTKYILAPVDSSTITYKYFTCDSVNSEQVYNSINLQVRQYIEEQIADYQAQYRLTCGSASGIADTLSLSYPQGVYHYTLYYYDRAGNLVRTTPPNGVLTSSTNRNTHPDHTFVTMYKYNSLKQLVQQYTPDGDTTSFWYDYKGQLRFSRNAKQKALSKYSYTKYDELGRIIEVGQSSNTYATFFNNVNTPNFPAANNEQRTNTVYNTPGANINYMGSLPQRYLQNRVSYTYNDDGAYTYYSYDPHGNVEWLIQDIPGLGKNYIRYEYDLISNKVLAVHYNEGYADEYHHRYTYDSDQRLLNVQTAWGKVDNNIVKAPQPRVVKQNSVGWDNDAKYKYYLHGPLKRTETGEDHVQGTDYVYTINGWLKGINYPTLLAADDPGGDNNRTFAADAFGMVLGYHDNDFNRTGSKFNPSFASLVSTSAAPPGQPGVNLYNGNISSWTLQTDTIGGISVRDPMGFKYKYDQLNRLKKEDYRKFTTLWTDPALSFDNSYTYDGNGNIRTLKRDGNGTNMDDLTYYYQYEGAEHPLAPPCCWPPPCICTEPLNTNRLITVSDNLSYTNNYLTDIDNQPASNYFYDKIGNLTKDVQEGIDNIDWTVYGKIKSVKKTNGDSIIFTYDAGGNRIAKYVRPNAGTPTVTYYVRDAGGNPLSMYERKTNGLNFEYKQTEIPIYGSDRLGLTQRTVLTSTKRANGTDPLSCLSCPKYYVTLDMQNQQGIYTRTLAKKIYELKDHLGNVRVTIGDRKYVDSTAQILSVSNYYAFGSPMPGRTFNANSYRYGYNKGSEKDDEIYGSGNAYTTEFRMLDTRLGRWWSIDPEEQENPDHSPYCSMGNNPIQNNDPDGDIFGLDNLVGAVVGAAIEVGTQITVNALSGKSGADLFDLDYGDIAIEAGVGFATSGVGNVLKAGKTTVRITNAIKTAEKVVESNKALKTVAKVSSAVGKDVVKAAVDVKKEGVKVVGVNKDVKEAAVDLAGSVAGKGVEKSGAAYLNKGLSKAASTAETKAARAMTGSANQAAYKGQAAAAKTQAKGNAKAAAVTSGVASGVAAEKAKKR